MMIKIGLREGFRLFKTFMKLNNKKLLLSSLIRGGGEAGSFLEFMFGRRTCYSGVIISDKGVVKHALYALISNGKVREVGSTELRSKKAGTAIKEFYKELSARGEVSKVMIYEEGRGARFHPS